MSSSFKAQVDPLLMKQLIQKSNQKGILHFGIFFWSFLELASFSFNYWERIGFFRFISFTLSFLLSQRPQPMSWIMTLYFVPDGWTPPRIGWSASCHGENRFTANTGIYDTIQKHRWLVRILRARRFVRKALDWWWLRCLQGFFMQKPILAPCWDILSGMYWQRTRKWFQRVCIKKWSFSHGFSWRAIYAWF